jgi:hypothetical protein
MSVMRVFTLRCHGPQKRATQVTRARMPLEFLEVYSTSTAQTATGWPAFAGHDNWGWV